MEERGFGVALCVALLCGAAWMVMGPAGLLLVMLFMAFASKN